MPNGPSAAPASCVIPFQPQILLLLHTTALPLALTVPIHPPLSCHRLPPPQRWFYASLDTLCGRLFECYCSRMGISLGAVHFQQRGARIFGASTLRQLKVRSSSQQLSTITAAGAPSRLPCLTPPSPLPMPPLRPCDPCRCGMARSCRWCLTPRTGSNGSVSSGLSTRRSLALLLWRRRRGATARFDGGCCRCITVTGTALLVSFFNLKVSRLHWSTLGRRSTP